MKINDIKSNCSDPQTISNKRLTLKQKRFVDSYIRNGGDGAQAVLDMGYNFTSTSSIHAILCENLKKPLIRLASEKQGYEDCGLIDSNAVIEARKIDEENNRISSRAERAAFLTKVFEDDSLIIGARLKAVDMLNKMYGDYRSDAILNDKAIEMPTINFILTDEDEKKYNSSI